jgi:hypothetical protein
MKTLGIAVVTIVLVLAAPAAPQAQQQQQQQQPQEQQAAPGFTGLRLAQVCAQTDNPTQNASCGWYLRGVFDVLLQIRNFSRTLPERASDAQLDQGLQDLRAFGAVCPTGDLQLERVGQAIVQTVQQNPAAGNQPAIGLAAAILRQAYPCQ